MDHTLVGLDMNGHGGDGIRVGKQTSLSQNELTGLNLRSTPLDYRTIKEKPQHNAGLVAARPKADEGL